MNALFVFSYNNRFLSETENDLNFRKEDEHKHEMTVHKNNRKSLELKLRNIEIWYFLQLFMLFLVMNIENKIWSRKKNFFVVFQHVGCLSGSILH
jgi:uncharacterized membrane protein